MYPIERYLKTLKGYVQNKARPEGNMAKGYALKEVLGFCTKHIQDFTTTRQRVWDDKEDPTMIDEVLEGGGWPQFMISNLRDMAHSFVLQNVELMATWRM
jgi:hypothetical protein